MILIHYPSLRVEFVPDKELDLSRSLVVDFSVFRMYSTNIPSNQLQHFREKGPFGVKYHLETAASIPFYNAISKIFPLLTA